MSFHLFSFKDGKHVGANPMLQFHPEDVRLRSGPPTWAEAWQEWSSCGMKLVNRETQTFSDPTVEDCVTITRHSFRALVWRKEDSVAWFEARRRCEVNPSRTPWRPRPEYLELLRAQKRVAAGENAHSEAAEAAGAPTGDAHAARALMESAIRSGESSRSA
jgi:hypothetical protein